MYQYELELSVVEPVSGATARRHAFVAPDDEAALAAAQRWARGARRVLGLQLYRRDGDTRSLVHTFGVTSVEVPQSVSGLDGPNMTGSAIVGGEGNA